LDSVIKAWYKPGTTDMAQLIDHKSIEGKTFKGVIYVAKCGHNRNKNKNKNKNEARKAIAVDWRT